jgi:hypothetical protein
MRHMQQRTTFVEDMTCRLVPAPDIMFVSYAPTSMSPCYRKINRKDDVVTLPAIVNNHHHNKGPVSSIVNDLKLNFYAY